MTHLKRWLTSIVAIPILILIIGPGPKWLFSIFISLASLLAFDEFLRIVSPGLPWAARILSYGVSLALIFLVSQGSSSFLPGLLSLGAMLIMSLYLFSHAAVRPRSTEQAGKIALGMLYICVPLCLLMALKNSPNGSAWIFFALGVVFSGDTGAFYSGHFWGRHKLYPSISPGKTWEGSAGGLLASLLAALAFFLFMDLSESFLVLIGLAACLSIAGQVGDLAESMVKRVHGVKDSGNILPGHGGILDRIDGLLFAIPVLYVFLTCGVL
jgi:phosphatidate cytidylyltransferase